MKSKLKHHNFPVLGWEVTRCYPQMLSIHVLAFEPLSEVGFEVGWQNPKPPKPYLCLMLLIAYMGLRDLKLWLRSLMLG
jgi:hypothetical protein